MSPVGRSAREQAEFEKFHFPGTGILRNRLGLQHRHDLELAERYFSAKRARQGFPTEAHRADVEGLRAVHRHLFRDLYDWAGEFRTYTTGRGAAPFAPPEQIRPWLKRQFTALKGENFLIGLDPDYFAVRVAFYVNEINAVHPFIEGNGRTQRAWLRILALPAGHRVRLRSSDRGRWNEASRVGFEKADPRPMADLLLEAISRGRRHDGTDSSDSGLKAPG